MASQSFTVRASAGVSVTAGKSLQGGNTRGRWLPHQSVPIIDDKGRCTPEWYRFFDELANIRLGGILGDTLPNVSTAATTATVATGKAQASISKVQASVVNIAAATNTITQVLNQAGTPGAKQIPSVVVSAIAP